MVFAVGKLTGPKDKGPTPNPNDTAKGEPKPPMPSPKLPKDKGEIPPRADPDGKVAQWVLSVGGKVTITDAAGAREILAPKDLPGGAFNVTIVHLHDVGDRMTDAHLEQFTRLAALTSLSLSNTGVTDEGLKHMTGMTGVTEMDEKPANPTPANPRVATCQVGLSCGHD